MSEPIKIEPHYQAQAKELVDHLFDKGYFSGALSRNGIDNVERWLARYLQLTAKGHQEGEDQPRHEEEMRWIIRAREAEARVAELEQAKAKWPPSWEKAPGWALEVGAFLKAMLEPPFVGPSTQGYAEASHLFTDAIALGIIPEPDSRPRKTIIVHTMDEAVAAASVIGYPIKVRTAFDLAPGGNSVVWNLAALQTLVAKALDASMVSEVMLEGDQAPEVRPGDGCLCPPEEPYPGQIILKAETCPKCGGRKI